MLGLVSLGKGQEIGLRFPLETYPGEGLKGNKAQLFPVYEEAHPLADIEGYLHGLSALFLCGSPKDPIVLVNQNLNTLYTELL